MMAQADTLLLEATAMILLPSLWDLGFTDFHQQLSLHPLLAPGLSLQQRESWVLANIIELRLQIFL